MSSVKHSNEVHDGDGKRAPTNTRELLRRNIESIRKEIAAGTVVDPDVLKHLESEMARLDRRDRSSE
jgi:hypothetical protein